MSIPLPTSDGKKEEFKSKCEFYNGSAETAGYCSFWVTKNSHCMKRDDELGKTCNGKGEFP